MKLSMKNSIKPPQKTRSRILILEQKKNSSAKKMTNTPQ